MVKYTLNAETELSTELLKKFVENFKSEMARYKRLEDYYKGKHDILNRTVQDASKPNHKIAHPYAQYITDTLCGYFLGEPITYTSVDEDTHNELTAILANNKVATEDMGLGKYASIYGKAYELHYIDKDGNLKFKKINPQNMFVIYDDSLEEEIIYAVRLIPFYNIENDKTTYKVEVYSKETVKLYQSDEQLGKFEFIEELPHYYGMVPVVEIKNDEYELGDYENIISLIDAYDILESDALNDFDYFVNAYLLLTGVMTDDETIQDMKEKRVIVLDEGSEAKWLIKSESDTVSENLKNRFKNDIHKFSKTPDLSDESFASNASGVAIKYKLYGTESLVSNKEAFFKEGLERRLQLIFSALGITSEERDWRSVDIQFTRNIPTNESEIADVVQKLSGVVSNETLLAQVPFVSDTKAELEKLEADKERNPFYNLNTELEAD